MGGHTHLLPALAVWLLSDGSLWVACLTLVSHKAGPLKGRSGDESVSHSTHVNTLAHASNISKPLWPAAVVKKKAPMRERVEH